MPKPSRKPCVVTTPPFRAYLYQNNPGDNDERCAMIIEACRLSGCICNPDVRFSGTPRKGEVIHADIYHDRSCPLGADAA